MENKGINKYSKQELETSIQAFEEIGKHIRIIPENKVKELGRFSMSVDLVRALEISIELLKVENKKV